MVSLFTMGALRTQAKRSHVDAATSKLGTGEDDLFEGDADGPADEQRIATAHLEPKWKGVGLRPGKVIWAIEKFDVIDWPKGKYGSFHKGDCYIVLHTTTDTKDKSKLKQTIYFWTGAESTEDEKKTAEFKAVEFKEFFDGEKFASLSHVVREQMEAESDEFKALFDGGIQYLESGFHPDFHKKMKDDYKYRIFQVRKAEGKNTILEMPWNAKYFHDADSYVVDAENKIYVVNGPGTSSFLKMNANKIAKKIENERRGISTEVIGLYNTGKTFCEVLQDCEPKIDGC